MTRARRISTIAYAVLAIAASSSAIASDRANELAPLASAKGDAAAKLNALQLVGTWNCLSATMIDGVQARFAGKQDYSRDGSALGVFIASFGGEAGEFRFEVATTGTWKVRKGDICETMGKARVSPKNAAAASAKGQQMQAGLQSGFDTMSQKGTAECSRIIKLDAKQFSSQSLSDKTLITNCSR